jgi:glutamine cyclotransferase
LALLPSELIKLIIYSGKTFRTGRYEHSTLREVDIKSGIISRSIQLEDSFFAFIELTVMKQKPLVKALASCG